MVAAIALWSLLLIPGEEPESFTPPCDLRITNVALGDELEDETGRTSLKLTYSHPSGAGSDSEEDSDGEEDDKDEDDGIEPITTVLCSLTPGKIEQAVVDLVLEQDQEVLFEAVGKNPIYLTGNFIDQEPGSHFHDEDDEDSDEEGYRLEDVSSDVEIDPDEMDVLSGEEDDSHRFEEVKEEVEKPLAKKDSKKRPRESTDADEGKPSKAEKKKAKKAKVDEPEKAVPAEGDEKVDVEEKKDKKKKDKKKKEGESKKDSEEAKPEVKGENKVLPSGLKIRDHKVGTGAKAKKGDTVGVRYVGKLDNGKIFDSNTKGKPFTFHLGQGEVIKGWDEGVAGMLLGGERLLVIPPGLAYGNKKQSGIPAGSTLTFEVKLVKIS